MSAQSHTLRTVRTARPRLTVRGFVDYLVALDAKHRARVQLARLDDRMLRDMGLSRSDVEPVLRKTLW